MADEPTANKADAVFMVLQMVVRGLVRSGALPPDHMAGAHEAYARMADDTLIPQKKADARLAADLCLILSISGNRDAGGGPVKHPRLRLVEDDEPNVPPE